MRHTLPSDDAKSEQPASQPVDFQSFRALDPAGDAYEVTVARTHWIESGEDIVAVVRRYLGPRVKDGDCVIVSEKACVIAAGAGIPLVDVEVRPLARLLARWVRPVGDSKGLSIPEKMQLVIDRTGRGRVLLATVAAAATRPFGVRGAFYVVAGDNARGMDGGRPPLEHLLLPPMDPREAFDLARRIEADAGVAAAVVDINDRGGSIRALSPMAPPAKSLLQILAENPLGQRDQSTPIGFVRRTG